VESELAFRSEDGSSVIPHLFTLAFKKAVKDAKLPPIRLHDLRHTHVALLAKAGVPAKVIQERVGHHSAGFTLDNYGGTFPAQHRDARPLRRCPREYRSVASGWLSLTY
jgi:integrase